MTKYLMILSAVVLCFGLFAVTADQAEAYPTFSTGGSPCYYVNSAGNQAYQFTAIYDSDGFLQGIWMAVWVKVNGSWSIDMLVYCPVGDWDNATNSGGPFCYRPDGSPKFDVQKELGPLDWVTVTHIPTGVSDTGFASATLP